MNLIKDQKPRKQQNVAKITAAPTHSLPCSNTNKTSDTMTYKPRFLRYKQSYAPNNISPFLPPPTMYYCKYPNR